MAVSLTIVPMLAPLLAPTAHAQSAEVIVTHDDPDGIVQPGETVRVVIVHSRSGPSILAGIGGSLVTTGNLGTASAISTQMLPWPPDPGYVNSVGTISGGSVTDVSHEFLAHPAFTPFIFPAYTTWTGVEVLSFDWTAPVLTAPTTINFDWHASPELPSVRAILQPFSQIIIEFIPTTYTGTSLLVIPAPPTAFTLPVIAAWATRRRRR